MQEVMCRPCTSLGNWAEIKDEISCSNVLQRDNVSFARKLDRNLLELAKEEDKDAKSFEQLWTERRRRAVMHKILEEWVKEHSEGATVSRLLSALGAAAHMDIRLRVEKLVEKTTS